MNFSARGASGSRLMIAGRTGDMSGDRGHVNSAVERIGRVALLFDATSKLSYRFVYQGPEPP